MTTDDATFARLHAVYGLSAATTYTVARRHGWSVWAALKVCRRQSWTFGSGEHSCAVNLYWRRMICAA